MKRSWKLIIAIALSLIAINTGVAHADTQTLTWASNLLPAANELGLDADFPVATSSASANITYTILDSSGSGCSYIGNYFDYQMNGNCYIQATAAATGSFTQVSTTRRFYVYTDHTGGATFLTRNVINIPSNETMTAGSSITLTDAGVDTGTGVATPTILESADSSCYLDGHTLYAPNPGLCYVTYTANSDPAFYTTMSAPQVITVTAPPAPVAPVNINVVAPSAVADSAESAPAPIVEQPGVPVVPTATAPLAIVVPTTTGATVSVSAPAGVLPANSSLTITPTVSPEAQKSGLLQVEVSAFDSSGARITHLNQVLTLNLGHLALTGNDVAYSQDGLVWHSIAKIDGTVLPDGVGEGYYLDENNNVVILTRHLTFYGTKRLAKDLILLTPSNTREIGTQIGLKLQGGSGTGALTYISLTPKICSITQQGVVTALAAGQCSVDAVKNGDSVYSSSTSGPLAITIKAKGVRVFTVGKKITVQTSLSPLYANTDVDLYMINPAAQASQGTASSKSSSIVEFEQKVQSSQRGAIRFTFLPNSLPKAFTIEVKSGEELLASTVANAP